MTTSHTGTINENNGNCRPAIWLIAVSGIPVTTVASVRMGVPSDPNATGAVLAINASPAACNGENPMPISTAEEIATGVPNPADPSRKVPNENAINRA